MLIPSSQNIKTITDMREDANGLLDDVQKLGIVYLFQRSNPKAVVVSMEEFGKLIEMVGDYKDAFEAEKILKDKKTKFIPLDQAWKKYNLAK